MNAFYILDLYYRLKEDPSLDLPPRVFIFGAKAAPGYVRAKAIIKLINSIGDLVNNDPDIDGRITVVFVENYNVSPAEHIIPAADVSEQISTAGKEVGHLEHEVHDERCTDAGHARWRERGDSGRCWPG